MEAPEVPIEKVHEDLHEHAHGHGKPGWAMGVALSTALLAVLAAIASLLAGHYANEGMLDQMKSSNEWSRYQAKSVKENVLRSKIDLLMALGKPINPKDTDKVAEYKKEEEELRASHGPARQTGAERDPVSGGDRRFGDCRAHRSALVLARRHRLRSGWHLFPDHRLPPLIRVRSAKRRGRHLSMPPRGVQFGSPGRRFRESFKKEKTRRPVEQAAGPGS